MTLSLSELENRPSVTGLVGRARSMAFGNRNMCCLTSSYNKLQTALGFRTKNVWWLERSGSGKAYHFSVRGKEAKGGPMTIYEEHLCCNSTDIRSKGQSHHKEGGKLSPRVLMASLHCSRHLLTSFGRSSELQTPELFPSLSPHFIHVSPEEASK